MRKTYFEKERINYVTAVMRGDDAEADKCLARMQGFKRAVYEFDIHEGFILHGEIMTAIDFGHRMWRMRRKKERQN